MLVKSSFDFGDLPDLACNELPANDFTYEFYLLFSQSSSNFLPPSYFIEHVLKLCEDVRIPIVDRMYDLFVSMHCIDLHLVTPFQIEALLII